MPRPTVESMDSNSLLDINIYMVMFVDNTDFTLDGKLEVKGRTNIINIHVNENTMDSIFSGSIEYIYPLMK